MAFSIRKATPADIPAMVDIYFRAFDGDAISVLCFPRTPAVHKFWADMLTSELTEHGVHFLVVLSPSPDPKVIAWAHWNSPLASPVSTSLPTWPEGCDVAVANHFFGTLFKRHTEIMEGRKHWYLELLCTDPDWQGKGAAGKLLRWGIEKADAEEVESYIEASPAGKGVYERFGWKEADRLVVDVRGQEEFVEVLMVRSVGGR
ncbi:acetyltransferase-like protein [Bisporella sp. PMI_857]|nr:acetyltransferase-like protein [Bisporella sp. PMI_857]